MDLEDIVEKSCVMAQVESNISDQDLCTMETLDIDAVWPNGAYTSGTIIVPFSIDYTTNNPGYGHIFKLLFDFYSTVTISGTSASTLSIGIVSYTTQGSSTYDVLIAIYADATNKFWGSTLNLTIKKQYYLVCNFSDPGSRVDIKVYLGYLDTNGTLVECISTGGSTSLNVQGTYYETLDSMRLIPVSSGVQTAFKIWEPMVGIPSIQPPSLPKYEIRQLSTRKRKLTYTYGTSSYVQYWITPPLDVVDGSAYDRSVLIDQLQTDLDAANADLDTLTSRLSALRAAYLDNIDNANLASIPNISTFTPTVIGYLNNNHLGQVPDLSNLFTTYLTPILSSTSVINWDNITSILAKTNTIIWDNITTIMGKTNTIDWDDITTLVTQIGEGLIAAIKTKTDTLNWNDITNVVTQVGDGWIAAIKAKTDVLDWTSIFETGKIKSSVVDELSKVLLNILNEIQITAEVPI